VRSQEQGNGIDDGVDVEVGTMELLDGAGALTAVDRAAIDIQVATAKRYPRSVDRSLKEALTLATLDEETAGSMFYALPRSGKTIEGPSARLAEVMAYSWGNLRVDADIVAEDRGTVTAMGTCFDLEKNVAVRVRVKRRITDKKGVRYNEDMIGVTSNAAISIALRNCVFKVIPAALTRRIYAEARKASLGKGGTITQKRQNALTWFGKMGVSDAQVFEVLGVRGIDDLGEDQLITLRGLKNAIQDGETTVEQTFRPSRHSEDTDELNAALKQNGEAPATEADPPAEEQQGPAPKAKATKAAIAKLRALRERVLQQTEEGLAREDREGIDLAITDADGAAVASWTQVLSERLGELGV
jgi:hypothetical protein